jgi:hypothetical protein
LQELPQLDQWRIGRGFRLALVDRLLLNPALLTRPLLPVAR